jgi:hypothetical protein
MKRENPNPAGMAGRPISLAPLSFEDALRGALQVKPPSKAKAKPRAKSTSKKTARKK